MLVVSKEKHTEMKRVAMAFNACHAAEWGFTGLSFICHGSPGAFCRHVPDSHRTSWWYFGMSPLAHLLLIGEKELGLPGSSAAAFYVRYVSLLFAPLPGNAVLWYFVNLVRSWTKWPFTADGLRGARTRRCTCAPSALRS